MPGVFHLCQLCQVINDKHLYLLNGQIMIWKVSYRNEKYNKLIQWLVTGHAILAPIFTLFTRKANVLDNHFLIFDPYSVIPNPYSRIPNPFTAHS